MNIEKIKEFNAIREELLNDGVIAVDMWGDYVHVSTKKLAEIVDYPNVKVETREGDPKYPYTVTTVVDGIKLLFVLTEEEFFQDPQLQGYMVEDVDLSGSSKDGDDHAA
ncbi:MAG: hypothetical protein Q8934_23965 [Bacillota bacterium]|nr:hypothetical protein [Bacillota bacterium]